jgi:hypothetical protein
MIMMPFCYNNQANALEFLRQISVHIAAAKRIGIIKHKKEDREKKKKGIVV